MSLLIVEDSSDKANQIRDVAEGFYDWSLISHVGNLRLAYPALQSRQWDIIILDMTLHAAEGQLSSSTKESLAGIEVLQALSTYDTPTRVIVATQHDVFKQDNIYFRTIDSLDEALREAFPENYHGIVKVTLGQDGWRQNLKNLIESAMPGSKRKKANVSP